MDPYIAIGRQKHHEAQVDGPVDQPSAAATVKQSMAHKLGTAVGKALYAARKYIVEPVFGQIKGVRGIRQFLRRGLDAVSSEWQLICLAHNFLKIWRHSTAAEPA